MDISFFEPMFQIKSYMCAGVDGLISKIHLLALKEGRLINDYIGMPLVVRNQVERNDSQLIHEVKRVGLLIDRYVDLELRVGDQLILYVSKS